MPPDDGSKIMIPDAPVNLSNNVGDLVERGFMWESGKRIHRDFATEYTQRKLDAWRGALMK
jgi:hypothetical protein